MKDRKSGQRVPLLIIGATALGLAAAAAFGEGAVVAERSGLAAWEFAASFEPGEGPWQAASPAGEALRQELVRRAVLSERGTHIQGAAPVFFRLIRERGLQVRFLTEAAELRQEDGGFAVTLADSAGLHSLRADAVLDTTSAGGLLPLEGRILQVSLNADLIPAGEGVPPPVCEEKDTLLVPGHFENEYYLKYWLEPSDTPARAREKLFAFWENRGSGLLDWRIAALSPFLSVRTEGGGQGKLLWRPSSGCRNLLEAFETGMALGAAGRNGW